MYSETRRLYRGIGFLTLLIFFALEFITAKTAFSANLIDLISNFSLILGFVFVTLWLKRVGLFVSLFIYLFLFNVELFNNPLTATSELPFLISAVGPYAFYFMIVAFILLILGMWDNSPIKPIRKEIDVKDYFIVMPVLIVTILIQLIPRIF